MSQSDETVIKHSAAEIQFRTSVADVPTMLVDGIMGVMFQADTTKLTFYEMVLDQNAREQHWARHTVTLAIPNEALTPIVEYMQRVVQMRKDQLAAAQKSV